MLSPKDRQRLNDLERIPAEQLTDAQRQELKRLKQTGFSMDFVARDRTMPPDDDKKKGDNTKK